MPRAPDRDPLTQAIRRMGEPSWLVLEVLTAGQAIPGIEILRRANELLQTSNYPATRLDPSTLHYALQRMQEDGLVQQRGEREVQVPGPRGSTRAELRPVYAIAALGEQALSRRHALQAATQRYRTTQGVPLVPEPGRA
jgi:DNA-binding PadR family transcriptional regulator